MITKIIVGFLTGVGFYFILADAMKIPYVRTSRAVNNLAKRQQEKTSVLDVWLGNIAAFLAKHMPRLAVCNRDSACKKG